MPENRVSSVLNKQRKSGRFCDVIVKLNSQFQLWGHFSVLADQSNFIGSKYFTNEAQFSIKNPITIEIMNFSCQNCLCDMLDYLYANDIVVSAEHRTHLKALSKILQVQELYELLGEDETEVPELEYEQVPDEDDVQTNSIIKMGAKTEKAELQETPENCSQPNGHPSRMYSCNGCKLKHYKSLDMLNHLLACDLTTSKCSLCDFKCDSVVELKTQHLPRHSDPKPFFCTDCPSRFRTRTALALHRPKHSPAAPFVCNICGKGFKWKQGLTSHFLVHTKEKKLLCDVCGFSTGRLKTLKVHKSGHSGVLWQCSVAGCTHSTRRKDNIRMHLTTHSSEKPFVCEVCGFSFRHRKNLNRHALMHMPKKLQQCPHCSFSSHRKDRLDDHVNRLHTEKPIQLELPEEPVNPIEAKKGPKKRPQKPTKTTHHFPTQFIPILPKPSSK
ncbi:zinc finger protein 501 [Lutzomyia longipalpis]|uniref:zinc finger protein 501 n=1 Tax=Lutzomyia longipalpis TaxID=7200 RepID=UPI002483B05A|nr:zinc finger protein 501 [Lutzomyia longipalpis]